MAYIVEGADGGAQFAAKRRHARHIHTCMHACMCKIGQFYIYITRITLYEKLFLDYYP